MVFFPSSETAAFFLRQLGSKEKADRKVSYLRWGRGGWMEEGRRMDEEKKSWWSRLKGSCRLVPEPDQSLVTLAGSELQLFHPTVRGAARWDCFVACRLRWARFVSVQFRGRAQSRAVEDLHSQIGGSRRMSLGKSLHVLVSLTQAEDGCDQREEMCLMWKSYEKADHWYAVT